MIIRFVSARAADRMNFIEMEKDRMTMRTERFQHIIAEFCVGDKKLWEIAEDFRTEMQWGLIDDRKSSLDRKSVV